MPRDSALNSRIVQRAGVCKHSQKKDLPFVRAHHDLLEYTGINIEGCATNKRHTQVWPDRHILLNSVWYISTKKHPSMLHALRTYLAQKTLLLSLAIARFLAVNTVGLSCALELVHPFQSAELLVVLLVLRRITPSRAANTTAVRAHNLLLLLRAPRSRAHGTSCV